MDSSILSNLEMLGKEFSEDVQQARNRQSLTGHFSNLFSDIRFSEALEFAEESKKNWKLVKSTFRNSLMPLYQQAGTWHHSLDKPFGYPGDFGMLEYVYDQVPHRLSTTALGELIDIWGLRQTLPTAVVERKNFLSYYLSMIAQHNTEDKKRILSVGCGSAREIRDMNPIDMEKFDVTLLDSDERGIDFAIGMMARHGTRFSLTKIVADAIKDDLSSVLCDSQFDIVYSFGILDYLPNKLALKLLENMKKVLLPSGKLVFCIKDHTKYDTWFYDWLFDWRFIHRTIDDGRELAAKSNLHVNREYRVAEGVIIIYECSRI